MKRIVLAIALVLFSCSCTDYGYLSIARDGSEEIDVLELKYKRYWTIEGYSRGSARYFEDARLAVEHPFRTRVIEPIDGRIDEMIEVSQGDDVVIIIEYEREHGTFDLNSRFYLYMTAPEIVIGQSVPIVPAGDSFSVGYKYDHAGAWRYDIGEGYVQLVSFDDDKLEVIFNMTYMVSQLYGTKMPDGYSPADPFFAKIEGTIIAEKFAW
jgi:hypothetical protein